MSESKTLIKIEDVSNYYESSGLEIFSKTEKTRVLKNVSFEIREREFFGLVGESGCGKSTLGKAILGLIDFEGEIQIDGKKRTKKNRKELAKKVQAVFQDPLSALNPRKTIGETLEEPLKIHGIGNRDERSRRVNEVLELIGLDSGYARRYPKELSGGQRQRICIGASLMLNPEIIIADEAVSALDVSVGSQILNLFQDLHDRFPLALMFISHNLDVVYYLCDRIAVMYAGTIVELGSAEDVYKNPTHPYTKLLLSSIPKPDGSRNITTATDNRIENEETELNATGLCSFLQNCPYASDECRKESPSLSDINGGIGEPHIVRCRLV